jgi:plasmid replication initiation protein
MDSHPYDEPDVVQSNFLIRSKALLSENRFTLSLIQKRVIYYIIREVYNASKTPRGNLEEGASPHWYRLHVNDMIKQINPSKGGNETLTCLSELDRLASDDYKFNLKWRLDNGAWAERKTRWILETDIKATTGYFDVHLPSVIVKMVEGLDGYFTELSLETSLRLKSHNQVRLYELLLSYSYKGVWEVGIKELREFLEIKDDSYPKFSHFKKWVLDKSVVKINDETNIKTTYEVIKDGITPRSIKFSIRDLSKEVPKKDPPLIPELISSGEEEHKDSPQERIYPEELESELKRRKVQIYKKYKGKPMPEEIFREVLTQTDLEDSSLISEAVKRRDAKDEEKKKGIQKKLTDDNIKVCTDYWYDHRHLYEDPSNYAESWIQFGSHTILFKDHNRVSFEKELSRYIKSKGESEDESDRRVQQRRVKKSLIGGTSDARKVDRRSPE